MNVTVFRNCSQMNLTPNTQLSVHIHSPREKKQGFTHSVFIDSVIETELPTLKLLHSLEVQYTVECHKVKLEKTSHKCNNAALDCQRRHKVPNTEAA